MLRFHHVDVEALAPWIDRLDPVEVDLCGLLQSMRKENPKVREYMQWGFFGMTTGFVHGCMPWVKLQKDALTDRIKHMCRLGLMHQPRRKYFIGARQIRLVRFSRKYWNHYGEINRRADFTRAREYSVPGDAPRASRETLDHINDQKMGDVLSRSFPPSPPSLMAAGGAGNRAAGGQEPKKIVPPLCPHCNQAVLYLDWPTCSRCSHTWPGGVSGAEYFAGIPGAVP